jgi:hypothetical protein
MKRRSQFFYYLLQILLSLILLEGISYFFLTHSANPLYRARRILQVDGQLGWRQQFQLNTTFESKPLWTDQRGFRINSPRDIVRPQDAELITLGPSSAFGWGVAGDETYTSLTAEAVKLRALNASEIGYSSLQGQRLYQQYFTELPRARVALIAYGINDLDRFRFFAESFENDSDFFARAPFHFPLLTRAAKLSALLSLVSLGSQELAYHWDCRPLALIQQRSGIDKSMDVLKELIAHLREQRITPVLINTPYHLRQKNSDFDRHLMSRDYSQAQLAARAGNCSEALASLQQAKAQEPERIAQDVQLFNIALRDFSEESRVSLIDAYRLLDTADADKNFVDPVHPSALGHRIISRQVIKSVLHSLNDSAE